MIEATERRRERVTHRRTEVRDVFLWTEEGGVYRAWLFACDVELVTAGEHGLERSETRRRQRIVEVEADRYDKLMGAVRRKADQLKTTEDTEA